MNLCNSFRVNKYLKPYDGTHDMTFQNQYGEYMSYTTAKALHFKPRAFSLSCTEERHMCTLN